MNFIKEFETELTKSLKQLKITSERSIAPYHHCNLVVTYQFHIFSSDVPIKHLEFPSFFSL